MTNEIPKSGQMESQAAALAEAFDALTSRLLAGEAIGVQDVRRLYPEHAEELLPLLPAVAALGDLSASGEPEPGGRDDARLPEVLGDFRLLRELGRGGMGVVYEAEQVSLGRRVALKILPLAATLDPRRLQRFLNEARAAACLHHTNIVPVFAVGSAQGVHFYAMQLIEGQTLAAVLCELRSQVGGEAAARAGAAAADQAHPSPQGAPGTESTAPQAALSTEGGIGKPEYMRAVGRLGVQAAEALDYAHQLGVVHRDVKPGNLMVDRRSQLWVTDFGLAQFKHGSDAGLTLTGDLVGTLRYMSPEQTLAKRVLIDHRTDVYSLGATLYELLTLEPAFPGNDRQELLRQIAVEEPVRPRRINKAIPAELETIVQKAMEKDPQDRYATAQDLADDLRHWLEDRPIKARRPSLRQVALRWARRHKPVLWAVAAVLLVALLLGGAAGLGWVRALAAAEGESRVLLQQARRLGQEEKWDEALSAAQHAQGLLTIVGADPGLRREAEELAKDLPMVARLEEVRREAAALGLPAEFEATDRGYATAFADYGLDLAALDARTAADRIRGSAVRIYLLEALDDWAHVKDVLSNGKDGEPVRAVARLADDDPWRQQLRDPRVRHDRAALERLAQEEGALAQPPGFLRLMGLLLRKAGAPDAAVRLLRAAQQRHPGDFYANRELAALLGRDPSKVADAIGFSRAALALRPQNPYSHTDLAVRLWRNGQMDEAVAECREAIGLKKDCAEAHCNLGGVLYGKKDLDGAIAESREAIRLEKHFAEAHNNLGGFLRDKKDLDGAIAELREAIRLKKDYAGAHRNLGIVLHEKKELDEAIAELREAIRLKKDFAEAHFSLGIVLHEKKELDGAIAELREAIRLKKDFAEAHSSLGVVLSDKGQLDEAIAELREAIRLKKDFAEAHNNLGVVLSDKGQLDEAIAESREAIRLKKDYAEAHGNLGRVLRDKKDLEGAIAELREAIRLKKDFAEAHDILGDALRSAGQPDGAIAELREAIRLKKDFAEAHNDLGFVLSENGQLDEAIAEYRTAIRLKKDFAVAYCNLGLVLCNKGQFAEALTYRRRGHELGSTNPRSAQWVKECERLVELDGKLTAILSGTELPASAAERTEYADVCYKKGLYSAAVRLYQEAVTVEPALVASPADGLRYNAACGAALAGTGAGKDAARLTDAERAGLRLQALDWLRADLDLWRGPLYRDPDKAQPEVALRMRHWLRDRDFNGVRGPDALAKLPQNERKDWQELWADVAETLARAQGKKTTKVK
jgi:serine/threonine protein kinase/Flp pilus assembly protein TadD